MNNQTYLQIAEPCHENWEAMTPQLQGRHCDFCAKTVVDFTLMSDGQILQHMQQAAGNTCGRFTNDQLNRALVAPLQPKWYMSGMWKYMLSSFLIFKGIQSKAQIKGEVKMEVVQQNNRNILGKVAYNPNAQKQFIVTGVITDAKNKLLSNVSIKNSRTGIAIVSYINGAFSIQAKKDDFLQISYLGFVTKTIKVENKIHNIVLNEKIVSSETSITVGMVAPVRYMNNNETKNIIRDAVTKEIIPFGTVEINVNKSKKTITVIENGEFTFKTKKTKDTIALTISSMGYMTKTLKVSGKDLQLHNNLQVIYLERKVKQEEIVTVQSIGRVIKCYGYTTGYITVKDSTITFQKPINIENVVAKPAQNLIAYPNPIAVNNQLNLSYTSTSNEVMLFQLTTLDGKIIKMQKEKVIEGINQFSIQVPSIAAQTIIVQIMNSKGKYVANSKIVVN